VAISEASLSVEEIVDLDRFPLHHPTGEVCRSLVEQCRADVRSDGLFELAGFLRLDAVATTLAALRPTINHDSFTHRRRHNIYFLPAVAGLAPDHPALRQMETSNRTVCADQMGGSPLLTLYGWPPLREFLAATIGVPELFAMDDALAQVNVMSYREGDALNWHFDRSEFTTTLLLQRPTAGGAFEFCPGVRTDAAPNHDAVGRLVAGQDPHVQRRHPEPGTLTVFAGRNTAHRVTPTVGSRDRVIAVYSFFERPGVQFSAQEQLGFYGRATPG
jgi:hypothetical protein